MCGEWRSIRRVADLQWELDATAIEAAFEDYQQAWFATSAKTGENVEAVFSEITERVLA